MNKKNKSITIVSITLGITLLIALEIIIVPTIAKFIKEKDIDVWLFQEACYNTINGLNNAIEIAKIVDYNVFFHKIK